MKEEVKENGQVVNRMNKAEFRKMVRTLLQDVTAKHCGEWIWQDDDSSLTIVYKDGSTLHLDYMCKVPPLKLGEMAQGLYANCHTYEVYNCEPTYNEAYQDWEFDI